MLKLTLFLFVIVAFMGICFSGMKMLWFLVDREIEKSKFYSFNPLVFLRYIEITKKENGRCGIWFQIQWVSFVLAMIGLILLIILYGE